MTDVLGWLKGLMSSRRRAEWLYRRGMRHAKLRDSELALADYTAVIEMEGATADMRAMALCNRALVHDAGADEEQAADDLNSVLEMPDASGKIKTEARRKLVRMERNA